MVIKKIKKKIQDKVKPVKKVKAFKLSKSKNKIKSTKKVRDFKVFKKVKKVLSVKKNIKKVVNSKTKKKISLKNKKIVKKENKSLKLKKLAHNPIIRPSDYPWESKATFNPAAFESNGKIHIVYRAIGEDDSSSLGYAYTLDGLNIEGRPTYHIYKRFFSCNEDCPKIDYLSGGGWSGGCEDPRLILIDDTVYMIFTAFDGWGSVRLALTSIKLKDFENKKWRNWKQAVMISSPNEINKNWVLFPEKINGKFAIMHSFYPRILIDYFDNLNELNGKKFIKSNNTRPVD